MPQQHHGSWSNVLLLWSLATVVLSPLCASSPTPTAAKGSTQGSKTDSTTDSKTDSETDSTADSPFRWDPVCNGPMLPRYAGNGHANYYVGRGRDMWEDLQEYPAITTMTNFCISDRGAKCSCTKLGQSAMSVVDCRGRYDSHYQALFQCLFHCTCPSLNPSALNPAALNPAALNHPALKPDPNPFSDMEDYVKIHGLPWEQTSRGAQD